ncbi:HAMP domain-containing sensor histidine kinase [Plantactinospora sonchi]|uniref:Oxygen sensor histidine kinase NreB n=1 Tax=Plantactinospora sonchi TaxID=1544735 RepID=A0ABU7RL95_9ACTN
MFSRFGLRSRMAVSYVLVSAAAVLVVEAVLLATMAPRIRSATESAEQAQRRMVEIADQMLQSKVENLALEMATVAGRKVGIAAVREPGAGDEALLVTVVEAGGIPDSVQREGAEHADVAQVLATVDGRVVGSEPATFLARDSRLPAEAVNPSASSGRTRMNGQPAGWASRPVEITDRTGDRRVMGIAYAVVVSEVKSLHAGKADVSTGDVSRRESRPGFGTGASQGIVSLLLPGVIVLILLLPVGALFGLASTGRLIRRIRKLAEATSAMADGELRTRLPVSGGDEVGRLEQAFNSMAERLDAAVHTERRAAGAEARRAERTRIARELHDSISQDLFSASMVAGGLRQALPAGSELGRQAGSLERSLARTMREMRALLLELRPIALEDAGLAEALVELCRTYEARLGISIAAQIDPPRLEAPVEHAVLRVVQEALGNALRHGRPDSIELRVTGTDGRVAVTVQDDGRGFDPRKTAGRHGMGLDLMRERLGELGGTLDVVSGPEQGTTVRVLLPTGTT